MARKLKEKDIDLLKVYTVKKEPSKHAAIIKIGLFPLIASICIAGFYSYNLYRAHTISKEIDDVNAKIAKIESAKETDKNYKTYVSANLLSISLVKLLHLDVALGSYPELSQKVFDNVLLASGTNVDVTSFSYTRESQNITLQIEARNANDPELFVRRLKSTDIFQYVSYSGYSYTEKTLESNAGLADNNTNNSNPNNNATENDQFVDIFKKLLEEDKKQTPVEQNKKVVYVSTIVCTLK